MPQIELKDLEIRSLGPKDLDRVYAIESLVYDEPWSKKLLGDSLVAPMTHSLGLFKAGDCLAYGIYQVVFSEGHLLNIAVNPSYQRQGLGSLLLDRCLEDSDRRGAISFFLEVRPSNTKAKELYEKKGFRALMLRDNYYANGEAALIMIYEFT